MSTPLRYSSSAAHGDGQQHGDARLCILAMTAVSQEGLVDRAIATRNKIVNLSTRSALPPRCPYRLCRSQQRVGHATSLTRAGGRSQGYPGCVLRGQFRTCTAVMCSGTVSTFDTSMPTGNARAGFRSLRTIRSLLPIAGNRRVVHAVFRFCVGDPGAPSVVTPAVRSR